MEKRETPVMKDGFAETASSIISGTISVFMLLLAVVFPLIYHDTYVDILETKYQCYYMIVLVMSVALLVIGLVLLFIDLKEYGGEHAGGLFSRLKPEHWKETFCLADVAVLLFWVCSVISTLQSEYLYESFWGNEGRYSGLFLLTLYVLAYFLISRFWKAPGWILQALIISGLIMCVIGITDYFQMDILDFRSRINPKQSTLFTSTVGNINTYTAYVGIMMGFEAALYAGETDQKKMVWYYVNMAICFVAIIMGCSENAYLAIGALFAFLPFWLFRTRRGVCRYLVILSTFATAVQITDWINQVFAEVVVGLDSVFEMLAGFGGLLPVVILLWAATAVFYYFFCREGNGEKKTGAWPVRAWSAFLLLCIAALLFMLVDANAMGGGSRYGALGQYLVFQDSWGTNRGYIWRKSAELYSQFPILHKLFGYGPDTFGILTTYNIRTDMVETTGQIYDSAHNAYLQYMLTIGITGMLTYILFHVSALWRMAKKLAKSPYVVACLFAVLCYDFQALVNLDLPIATPIMWFLLSTGMAFAGKGRAAAPDGEER
ncbi:MAG: O-antigen ligase family protein [Clostridiales bacterium]|nr:O-antigen ligase family protein [Clostridiales bacterium]